MALLKDEKTPSLFYQCLITATRITISVIELIITKAVPTSILFPH